MESNVNTYKITQNNKEYTLTASIVQNSVRLMCKNNSNTSIKFCRDYTVEQLKQLDQIFNTIQTPLQALEYIDKALRLEKVSITEDAQEIKINFFYKSKTSLIKLKFLYKKQIPLPQLRLLIHTIIQILIYHHIIKLI